ncbi:MAG: M48 family metalloprotease [Bacteroidales bacterium]|nr:M48 family metalloprotease [Bacteroidales bacterium]
MKKIALIIISVLALSGCGLISKINWDTAQLQQATQMALSAVTITDAQVIALSQQTVQQLDAQNTIDNGTYAKRLNNLLASVKDIDGVPVNYKVYKLDEVNAFACGDGSIRVYSGLMDIMNDDELMAIIGHECGHVSHQDTKHAMKNAYLAAAARGVIASAGGTTIATLSKGVLGDLGESYISSQYSQKQEFAADEYGFQFAVEHGHTPYSMATALEKLVKLSTGSQASKVQKMFSSHPDSETRAARMREKADKYSKK